MSNIQFCLTIGIPTFAVLIGMLMDAIQFKSLHARFSSMDARLSSQDARRVIDLDNRFTRIEAKLDIR